MTTTRDIKYYVCTDGSLGDVIPMLQIARELRRAGQSVAVIANERYQPLCEEAGAGFIPWSKKRDLETFWDNAQNWDRFKGFEQFIQTWVANVTPALVDILKSVCTPHTTVIAQTMALGARIARELVPFRLVTVHLQPIFLRGRYRVPLFPFAHKNFRLPLFAADALFALTDLFADRALRPIAAIRRAYGLPRVRRMLHCWIHSPDRTIALFPEWFSAPQPDWPASVLQTGFPGQAGLFKEKLDTQTADFLKNNKRPVFVCLGSAQKHAEPLYHLIFTALRRLNLPVIAGIPFGMASAPRDPGILVTRFIPFDQALPQCCAFIHHGGIGSSAAGFEAGIPQLVLPMAHDQFDNAAGIQALRCGRFVAARSCNEQRLRRFMQEVNSGVFREGCACARGCYDSPGALRKTRELCLMTDGILP
jgi:rhamnosyltransferase subunit B